VKLLDASIPVPGTFRKLYTSPDLISPAKPVLAAALSLVLQATPDIPQGGPVARPCRPAPPRSNCGWTRRKSLKRRKRSDTSPDDRAALDLSPQPGRASVDHAIDKRNAAHPPRQIGEGMSAFEFVKII
jgi:hypothetical protein